MKQKLDDAVYNGIERGFITGDQEVLDQLQQATGLYSDYMATVGRGVVETRFRSAIDRSKLSPNQYTPFRWTKPIVRVKTNLLQINRGRGFRQVEKALAQMTTGKAIHYAAQRRHHDQGFAGKGGEVTRTSIVNNYNDVFFKNRDIINREIFTPRIEIAGLKILDQRAKHMG